MELKEIWEQEINKRLNGSAATKGAQEIFTNGFLSGCEFEARRQKWFDPEKVLPEEDFSAVPLTRGNKESISVLIITEHDQIETAYYSFTNDQWSCDDKVISWTYIPN